MPALFNLRPRPSSAHGATDEDIAEWEDDASFMIGFLNGLLLVVPIWFGIIRLAMWLWGGTV